jgi:hypothetical protein
MKFDLNQSVSDNIYYINRYRLQMKWEKPIELIAVSFLAILGVWRYAEMKASLFLWIFLACTIVLGGLFWVVYRRIYDRSIRSILKNLDELKAFRKNDLL